MSDLKARRTEPGLKLAVGQETARVTKRHH